MSESENNLSLPSILELAPAIFAFCNVLDLQKMFFINKKILDLIHSKGDVCGYWQACCVNLSKEYGLYISEERNHTGNKFFFFSELWYSREKFDNESQSMVSFKIQVASRFRPGKQDNRGITVPLHQFLKVKRQQLTTSEPEKTVLVGTAEPEHFLDPILGTIMKDPVMLSTSGRIVDRSVAIQYLLRGGRDPFSNKKMSNESLIPQMDLKVQIADWKKQKYTQNVNLDANEVKMLVDEASIDPDIICALMEAQQLDFAAKRSLCDLAEESSYSRNRTDLNHETVPENIHESFAENLSVDHPEDLQYLADLGRVAPINIGDVNSGLGNYEQSKALDENEECTKKWNKQKESPKLLEVSNEKSCVSVNVPGTGKT